MTFLEPTRRLPFSPRLSYDGRYGASLVSLVLGGYLLLNSNITQLAIALGGSTAFAPDQVAYFSIQFIFAIAVIVFGFAIAPAALGRRVMAVVLALVLIILWTLLYTARITGTGGPLPFASGFVSAPAFIVTLVLATGWLIVRERPWVTYLLLLLTLLAGAIPFSLVLNGASAVPTQLAGFLVAAVVGAGIAWLARAVAGAIQQSHDRDPLVDEPPAV
ncbi:MAG TPA: hypothetical protein VGO65_02605 [Pseudolysinimonas sp.]|nr:hypothetical protein [Pseudolysinimonas sp.]